MVQTEALLEVPVVTTVMVLKFEVKMKSSKITSEKTFLILY